MTERDTRNMRKMAIIWGVTSEICLGSILFIWLTIPEAVFHTFFGRGGSIGLIAAACLVTAAGTFAAALRKQTSSHLRWFLTLPISITGSIIGTLTIMGIFVDKHGLWLLLGYGAVGMHIVAWNLSRVKSAPIPTGKGS
jgi:hypothetical protein